MIPESIKFQIQGRRWMHFSTPAHLMTCYPWVLGAVRPPEGFKESYRDMWLFLKDTLGFQYFDGAQTYKNIEQFYKDPEGAMRLLTAWEKDKDAFLKHAETATIGIENRSNVDVYAEYSAFLDGFVKAWASSFAVDGMEAYTETALLEKFVAALPPGERENEDEHFAALSQPSYFSFVAREHLSLLLLAIAIKEHDPEYAAKLEEHAENFYWAENGYKNIQVLSPEYFGKKAEAESAKSVEALREELKKIEAGPGMIDEYRRELIRRLKLPPELAAEILVTPILGEWLDRRKEMNLRGLHYLAVFLSDIGRRTGYTLSEMYYVLPGETETMLKGGVSPSRELIKERIRRTVYMADRSGDVRIWSGKEAEELMDLIESAEHKKEESAVLKGLVASRGKEKKYRGKVRVILDPLGASFEEGEVLVSTMTRPEFVPLMKKAVAIVTDEGGITSHAAIVSREMEKPCIIGTKHATKILKDGDVVEITIEEGTIKKLRSGS